MDSKKYAVGYVGEVLTMLLVLKEVILVLLWEV